ncbi:MAG: hypothetical protein KGN77_02145 [Xanthomonadaceae bacterium]|nr:hypothetical protein [Xanthomonadaceae bacterium]MDE1964178.1 hypothetical protein [Xanthomonadaceae bacterium]
MNAATVLLTPWRAVPVGTRRLMAAFYLLACIAGTLIALFGHARTPWLAVALTYGVGLFAPWAFLFSGTVLLAKDARQLRVPALERVAVEALFAYALAMLLLPTAVFALIGWPWATPMIGWSLVMVGGFAFALLPRYVAVFCGFLPTLGHALAPGWPRLFPHAGGEPLPEIALLVLLAVAGWRWRGFVRGRISEQGWSSPTVVQLRYGSWGAWSQMQASGRNTLTLGQGGGNVAGCGPSRPVRSLRVGLGGWYTPRSLRWHVQQLAFMTVLLGVPALAIWLGHLRSSGGQDHGNVAVLLGAFFGFAVVASPMVCLLSWTWLSRRWQRVNTELPMLALLPGLGSAQARQQALLRAALQRPLAAHAACFVLVLAGSPWMPDALPVIGLQAVAVAVGALTSIALVLDVLGGRPHGLWTAGPLLAAMFVLQMASLVIGTLLGSHHAPGHASALLAGLLVGAGLLAGWSAHLARAGWRALAARPQPFVANPA